MKSAGARQGDQRAQPPLAPATLDESTARLTFWLGFPAVLGLFSGWNQIGMIAPYLTQAWSLIYWLLLSAIMWAGVGLTTIAVSRVVPHWPLWAKLSTGAVVGVTLTRPMHAAFQALFLPLTANPETIRLLPAFPITPGDWMLLFSGNAMLMMFWTGGVLFFAHYVGFAPFGNVSHAPATATPSTTRRMPLVASKLDRLQFDDVDVIQAEDHYLRFSGGKGEELILYRFADAVAELSAVGWTRVHRSYCVRDCAVASREARGRTLELIMRGGQRVPASERYRAVADRLAI